MQLSLGRSLLQHIKHHFYSQNIDSPSNLLGELNGYFTSEFINGTNLSNIALKWKINENSNSEITEEILSHTKLLLGYDGMEMIFSIINDAYNKSVEGLYYDIKKYCECPEEVDLYTYISKTDINITYKAIIIQIFWLTAAKLSIHVISGIITSAYDAKNIQEKLTAKDFNSLLSKLEQTLFSLILANVEKMINQYTWRLSTLNSLAFRSMIYFVGVVTTMIANFQGVSNTRIKNWMDEAEKSKTVISVPRRLHKKAQR